ncbi:hypothetical protein CH63R_07447 [Colletotrichum higginsianum IMI 349063]|uniref:Uncharacterized protein n=3 Tax=Colletotrichum higginsianum TaxID=80884 RepID=A0A1B7Y9D6_COLHI|nr:hypothetical protein CH63R_07447 [Colletotrichum higginsianum IMI 349063]OBR08682.1 hypothetical protein CH63R_07447 [Colletotrichum higginsianum IMI 349063]
MKPSTLFCALGFVQLGMAIPVPATLSDLVTHVKGEARRLTKITRVSMHHTPPISTVKEPEEQKIEFRFDNSPVSPSEDVPPSLVLAAPRPLKTTYLQSLSKHPGSGKDRVVDVVGDGTPETIKPMTLEEGLAKLLPSKPRLGCWKHVQGPTPSMSVVDQHPDLIVLGAVLALVLVLLVLETVGTTFQGVRQHYDPRGEIRLEGDEKPCKSPSFRCDSCDSVPYEDDVGVQGPRS